MFTKVMVSLMILTTLVATAALIYLQHKKPAHPIPVCPVCEKCQDFSDTLKRIDTLTRIVSIEPIGTKVDEIGAGVAQVGIYEKLDDAKQDKIALRKYLKDCTALSTAWFCFDKLQDRIEIRQGIAAYFLVIKDLTSPQLFALCNFMWSNMSMERWPRTHPSTEGNHMCREFNHEYTKL
jgi:hypothetical protein